MNDKLKQWWEKWKAWVSFAGAFLLWAAGYAIWHFMLKRQGDPPQPPTRDADIEINAAKRDVQTEAKRQSDIQAAQRQREEAARAVKEEIQRREQEAAKQNKEIDDLAANGTDQELIDALKKQIERD